MLIHPTRRSILAAGALLPLTGAVSAESQWPNRSLKIVSGSPAGATADVAARLIAEKLSKNLGQPVVIDTRTGAGGNISMDFVAKAPADGYTLLYGVSSGFVSNPFLYSRLPFDVSKDFVPLGAHLVGGFTFIVNKDFPAKTVDELISVVKANPGKYSYASYGVGTFPHLFMEMFLSASGLSVTHVPYRTPPLPDVVSGNVAMMFDVPQISLPYIKDGRVRALAYVGLKRLPAIPDVPTLGEFNPSFTDLSAFNGLYVRSSTPEPILKRLSEEVMKAGGDPEVQEGLRAMNLEPVNWSGEQVAAAIRRDQARFGEFIKSKNMRIE